RPAAAGHLPPGELIDDDDLAILDDVVAVALVKGMSAKRLFEMARKDGIRVIQVWDAQHLLHSGNAGLGGADGAILEIDEVVAALLVAFRTWTKLGNQAGKRVVLVGRLL